MILIPPTTTTTAPTTTPSITARRQQYHQFITSKIKAHLPSGFTVTASELNDLLKPWQNDITRWAVRTGRCAIFADTGLGKTFMQLEWATRIHQHTQKPIIIFCPLSVARQTNDEATHFNIASLAKVCRDQSDVVDGINIANYERMHLFDPSAFSAIVLDESSYPLKGRGAMFKQVMEFSRNIHYRLCCTATPAPNDLMELGNHAEFLGAMTRGEMLSMFFTHDSAQTQKWVLRPHGAAWFWRWVASWAIAINKPSDLGYPDDEYILPPLRVHEDVIPDPPQDNTPRNGMLFPEVSRGEGKISATQIHGVKRESASIRADRVAEIIASTDENEPWAIWCDTDYESDELRRTIPSAIEVRGSHSPDRKEKAIGAFLRGEEKRIISKPEIMGFGLNFQHCRNTAFIGLNYSMERYYQAVRRFWRFGQKHPVNVHIVSTEQERVLAKTVFSKEEMHNYMKASMVDAMRETQMENLYGSHLKQQEIKKQKAMEVPSWL